MMVKIPHFQGGGRILRFFYNIIFLYIYIFYRVQYNTIQYCFRQKCTSGTMTMQKRHKTQKKKQKKQKQNKTKKTKKQNNTKLNDTVHSEGGGGGGEGRMTVEPFADVTCVELVHDR